MAKQESYCIIDIPYSMVMPAELAMQLFPLLCHGEPVSYDWQDKTHKRVSADRDKASIKQFTIAQYAALALNDEVK